MQESMVQKVRGKMRPVRLMYARQLSPKVSSIIRCSLEMRPKNKIPKPTMPEKPATEFASSYA